MMNRSNDFDEQEEMGEQAPAHIWLRYATQFTSGDRSYTIDIGIPVPLGADAQTREQLLREADAGLDQLANYVERRVMQVAQQSGAQPAAPARPVSPPIPAPTPVAAPTPISLPASAPVSQSVSPIGSTGRPQTPAAQVSPTRESLPASPSPSTPVSPAIPKKQAAAPATPAAPAIAVPPSRPNIGASMPPSPGLPAGTLSLPEFLKYLKEMGLDAKGAMALLKVKSLSGLNLREALEQLQHILMQEGANATVSGAAPTAQTARVPTGPQAPAQKQPSSSRTASGESHSTSNPANLAGSSREKAGASGPNKPTAGVSQPPQAPQAPSSTPTARSTPSASHSAPATSASSRQGGSVAPTSVPPVTPAARPSPVANSTRQAAGGPQSSVLHEGKLPYSVPVVFDEEEDDADLEDIFGEDEDEDLEASFGVGGGLSAANRDSAEDIVSRLREVGGSSPVSPTRLKVLHNIIDGQLTPEQLQALIRGVWGTNSDKKLKSEQAEELISWGKQDEFVTEAEMVLALFEEDGNASSNR